MTVVVGITHVGAMGRSCLLQIPHSATWLIKAMERVILPLEVGYFVNSVLTTLKTACNMASRVVSGREKSFVSTFSSTILVNLLPHCLVECTLSSIYILGLIGPFLRIPSPKYGSPFQGTGFSHQGMGEGNSPMETAYFANSVLTA